jgi:hypothetical protein
LNSPRHASASIDLGSRERVNSSLSSTPQVELLKKTHPVAYTDIESL